MLFRSSVNAVPGRAASQAISARATNLYVLLWKENGCYANESFLHGDLRLGVDDFIFLGER